jgi:hypothetical protein
VSTHPLANVRIPLGLRHRAFTGYTLSAEGVTAASGRLYRFLDEDAAWAMLRAAVRGLDPELGASMRATPLDIALRDLAVAACAIKHTTEEHRAVAILTWLTAETIDATWAACDAGGDA